MKIPGLFLLIFMVVMTGCVSTESKETTTPVEEVEPEEAAGEVIYSFGFESGEPEDWVSKGPVVLTVTDETAHTGEYSMSATGREATWNGPEILITDMVKEAWQYNVSVWLYIPEGSPAGSIKLTVQTMVEGVNNWIQIAQPVEVSPGEWTTIKGSYQHTGTFETVTMYVERIDSTEDFYIDDVEIKAVELDS